MKNNVLNFSREIIDLICDDFKDDERLVIDVLRYLYYTSTDDKMKEQIVMILNDYQYCLECGNKLETYTYEEPHTELNPIAYEIMTDVYCPVCDFCDFYKIKDAKGGF